MTMSDKKYLSEAALKARLSAYVPYSGFAVGAALLTKDGRVYTGCNIENASYPAGICAERTAIFKAVSEGKKEFAAIAIAGGKVGEEPEDYCAPCGICRQVMSEFCGEDFVILLVKSPDDCREYTLKELLPLAFELK